MGWVAKQALADKINEYFLYSLINGAEADIEMPVLADIRI